MEKRTSKEIMNMMLISFSLPQNLLGKLYFLPIVFSINCLKSKPMRYPMNLGNVICFPRNSQICGGIWFKWQFLFLKG
jgi:hypothetical protein